MNEKSTKKGLFCFVSAQQMKKVEIKTVLFKMQKHAGEAFLET